MFVILAAAQVTKTRAYIDADTGALLTSITYRSFEADAKHGSDRFPKVSWGHLVVLGVISTAGFIKSGVWQLVVQSAECVRPPAGGCCVTGKRLQGSNWHT